MTSWVLGLLQAKEDWNRIFHFPEKCPSRWAVGWLARAYLSLSLLEIASWAARVQDSWSQKESKQEAACSSVHGGREGVTPWNFCCILHQMHQKHWSLLCCLVYQLLTHQLLNQFRTVSYVKCSLHSLWATDIVGSAAVSECRVVWYGCLVALLNHSQLSWFQVAGFVLLTTLCKVCVRSRCSCFAPVAQAVSNF